MGETGIWYGTLEICRQPLQSLMLYFISSGNLPLDLEHKVCFRGNSAPFWHKRFFSNVTWQILSPVELFPLCPWGRIHALAGLLCLGWAPLWGSASSWHGGSSGTWDCCWRSLLTTFQSRVHTHHPQHPQGISLFLQKTKISFDPCYWAATSEPFCFPFPKKQYN